MRADPGDGLREDLIPLSDAAGTVSAMGPGVTRWRVGDRVAPTFFADWQQGPFRAAYFGSALGGGQTDGVLSEQIIVAQDALVAVPPHLSPAQAAVLPCAGVTAWHALLERGGLKAGDTLLVQGAGGVALLALQMAVAVDARVIVMSSSDEKLQRARELGAWQTINDRVQPQWDQEVLRLTGGEGATHVLELGGPDTFERSIASVAAGGHILQIGVLRGFGPRPNLLPLQFGNASIHGVTVGSGEHFDRMNRFLSEHAIRPAIDREFAFEEVEAAYDHLQSGKHFGKVAIVL
ncbi:MAG: zinc-dependent alcohol dehydrogenase family protein [Burkholderiaceae bacterium]